MLLCLLGGVFGGHLRRIGGRFPRAFETHGPSRRPSDGVALRVCNCDHGIVETRIHMCNARGDVLAFAAANAGGFFTHSRSFRGLAQTGRHSAVAPSLFLLAGNRLRGSLAGAGIGMSSLSTDRQTSSMTQPTIAAKVHQPLDIHGHFASQVTFDQVVTVDHFANLQDFLVGQLRHTTLAGNADLVHNFTGLFRSDSMDVLQGDDDPLVGRYIDTCNTSHGSNSFCQLRNRRLMMRAPSVEKPANQSITRHPPRLVLRARYRYLTSPTG